MKKTQEMKRTEFVAMSIGITDSDKDKFPKVYEQVGDYLKYVCVDVANGYSERFADFINELRQQCPKYCYYCR